MVEIQGNWVKITRKVGKTGKTMKSRLKSRKNDENLVQIQGEIVEIGLNPGKMVKKGLNGGNRVKIQEKW